MGPGSESRVRTAGTLHVVQVHAVSDLMSFWAVVPKNACSCISSNPLKHHREEGHMNLQFSTLLVCPSTVNGELSCPSVRVEGDALWNFGPEGENQTEVKLEGA